MKIADKLAAIIAIMETGANVAPELNVLMGEVIESETKVGRPSLLEDEQKVKEILSAIDADNLPSRHTLLLLAENGLVTYDKGEQKNSRGRKPYIWRLTEAARKMLTADETAETQTA